MNPRYQQEIFQQFERHLPGGWFRLLANKQGPLFPVAWALCGAMAGLQESIESASEMAIPATSSGFWLSLHLLGLGLRRRPEETDPQAYQRYQFEFLPTRNTREGLLTSVSAYSGLPSQATRLETNFGEGRYGELLLRIETEDPWQDFDWWWVKAFFSEWVANGLSRRVSLRAVGTRTLALPPFTAEHRFPTSVDMLAPFWERPAFVNELRLVDIERQFQTYVTVGPLGHEDPDTSPVGIEILGAIYDDNAGFVLPDPESWTALGIQFEGSEVAAEALLPPYQGFVLPDPDSWTTLAVEFRSGGWERLPDPPTWVALTVADIPRSAGSLSTVEISQNLLATVDAATWNDDVWRLRALWEGLKATQQPGQPFFYWADSQTHHSIDVTYNPDAFEIPFEELGLLRMFGFGPWTLTLGMDGDESSTTVEVPVEALDLAGEWWSNAADTRRRDNPLGTEAMGTTNIGPTHALAAPASFLVPSGTDTWAALDTVDERALTSGDPLLYLNTEFLLAKANQRRRFTEFELGLGYRYPSYLVDDGWVLPAPNSYVLPAAAQFELPIMAEPWQLNEDLPVYQTVHYRRIDCLVPAHVNVGFLFSLHHA